mmetsp:Transcript_984/g.2822  ORF Transcript_984/g.2822 Transcript_984/m.2822 type:complete len:89 (-) Transcript_984:42-308(-)
MAAYTSSWGVLYERVVDSLCVKPSRSKKSFCPRRPIDILLAEQNAEPRLDAASATVALKAKQTQVRSERFEAGMIAQTTGGLVSNGSL